MRLNKLLLVPIGMALFNPMAHGQGLKVHGTIEIGGSSTNYKNVPTFRVGEAPKPKNPKNPDEPEIHEISRVNSSRFEKSCAVEVLEALKDWHKNGIKDKDLEKAIADYRAEFPDADSLSWEPVMYADFQQRSEGIEKDGTRRFRPVHHLKYYNMILGIGVHKTANRVNLNTGDLDDYQTSWSSAGDSDSCQGLARPEEAARRLTKEIQRKTKDMREDKIREAEEAVAKKYQNRIREAEFDDLMEPETQGSVDSAQ